ncbi:hypothetical protein ACLB1Q_34635 [Escherichia coli]
MGKVTLPAVAWGHRDWFCRICFNQLLLQVRIYTKKECINRSDTISIEDGSNAFPVQTVIMNDPTLIDKFVGEDNINEENAFDYHKSNVLEPNYKHEISRTSQIDKAE